MTKIYLKTLINAPVNKVFNVSRCIDFHLESSSKTKEEVIAGRASGLIKLGETVTWKGKHFGIYWTHKSLLTSFEYPTKFTDEMVAGHFKTFRHEHLFNKTYHGTEMVDILEYEVPYKFLGKLFDNTLLKKHLTLFLKTRNKAIKKHLEGQKVI